MEQEGSRPLSEHQMHCVHVKFPQQATMWKQHEPHKLQLAQVHYRCTGHASSLPLLFHTLLLEHGLETLFGLPRLPLHAARSHDSA